MAGHSSPSASLPRAVAALIAGLLPALRASSPGQAGSLKGSRSSAGRGERRLLAAIATVQVICTVALLAGAALLIRTASRLASVRPGYETERVLAVTVTNVTPGTSTQFHTAVLERVAALPGVVRTAFVWGLPLTGNKWPGTMELIGQAGADTVSGQLNLPLRSITPDYFDLMGMGIIDGRGVSIDRQRRRAAGRRREPGVLAEVLSRLRCARTADALPGRCEAADRDRGDRLRHQDGSAQRTGRARGLSLVLAERRVLEAPRGAHRIGPDCGRGAGPTRSPCASIPRPQSSISPRWRRSAGDSIAPRTFAMRLLLGFSILATVLALVGIYGVLSLSVGSRVKEIAVRKAVGAQRHDILRLILGEGSRMIAHRHRPRHRRLDLRRPGARRSALRSPSRRSRSLSVPRHSSSGSWRS